MYGVVLLQFALPCNVYIFHAYISSSTPHVIFIIMYTLISHCCESVHNKFIVVFIIFRTETMF